MKTENTNPRMHKYRAKRKSEGFKSTTFQVWYKDQNEIDTIRAHLKQHPELTIQDMLTGYIEMTSQAPVAENQPAAKQENHMAPEQTENSKTGSNTESEHDGYGDEDQVKKAGLF